MFHSITIVSKNIHIEVSLFKLERKRDIDVMVPSLIVFSSSIVHNLCAKRKSSQFPLVPSIVVSLVFRNRALLSTCKYMTICI